MVKVLVASLNPVKVNSVLSAFSRYFPELEVEGVQNSLQIPLQPLNEESFKGAEMRASHIFESQKGFDFYVGIEGGIIEIFGKWFSFGVVCISNSYGVKSFGTSVLFPIPAAVVEEVKNGKELGEIIDSLEGKKDTKKQGGAISFLTSGVLTREKIYTDAVISALIPFTKSELFNYK